MNDKGNITAENRKDMPNRGKAKKTLMLEAIRAEYKGGELEFFQGVVKHAMGSPETQAEDDDGQLQTVAAVPANPVLLNLVITRIEPPLKAMMPLTEFEFDPKLKPHEQAAQVIDAVSTGTITPDVGSMFVATIKSMLEIEEHTELKARIEKLEAMVNAESS